MTYPLMLNLFLLSHLIYNRVGRTARGEGSSGHALLILRPEEIGFLKYLKQAKVPLNEFEFSWSKIADIQLQVRFLLIFCGNFH
jgi:ATP-dependent RNA helicase DDX18/HAS1